MRKKIIAITSTVVMGGIAAHFLLSSPQKKTEDSRVEQNQTRLKNDASKSPAVNSSPTENAEKSQDPFVPAKKELRFSEEQQKVLQEYAVIKEKVFLSDSDKVTQRNLLSDHAFLLNLKPVFKKVDPKDVENTQLQNAAIDLLLEAQLRNQSEAAVEVLKSIVEDTQVEDTGLSEADKKALAGLKAEVLYRWSSQAPDMENEIIALLPGPVSQQIWKSVQSVQENNRLESMAEYKQ